jgi:hypothetical protein
MDHTSWFLTPPFSRTTRNFGGFHYFFSSSTTFMKLHLLMVRFYSMIFYDPLSLRKCVIGLISLFLLSSMKLGFWFGKVGTWNMSCFNLHKFMDQEARALSLFESFDVNLGSRLKVRVPRESRSGLMMFMVCMANWKQLVGVRSWARVWIMFLGSIEALGARKQTRIGFVKGRWCLLELEAWNGFENLQGEFLR